MLGLKKAKILVNVFIFTLNYCNFIKSGQPKYSFDLGINKIFTRLVLFSHLPHKIGLKCVTQLKHSK